MSLPFRKILIANCGEIAVQITRACPPASSEEEEVKQMANVKVSLCPACGACPEVDMLTDEVRIGEAGNLAVLKKAEWNVLVDLIQSGQLSKI